ncbi:MAG: hypothetical protein HY313_04160 [Acidobacteria bacterium]|nr:hypothetical protein [Acidobacteriota bacterium]
MSGKPSAKTSLRLPEQLWQKTRIEAIKRGIDAQDIVAEALEQYFSRKGGKQ